MTGTSAKECTDSDLSSSVDSHSRENPESTSANPDVSNANEDDVSARPKDVCAICLDDMLKDDEIEKMHCDHSFHFICLEGWLKEHRTCPICRSERQGGNPEYTEGVNRDGHFVPATLHARTRCFNARFWRHLNWERMMRMGWTRDQMLQFEDRMMRWGSSMVQLLRMGWSMENIALVEARMMRIGWSRAQIAWFETQIPRMRYREWTQQLRQMEQTWRMERMQRI